MILDGGYSIEEMILMTIGLAVSVIPEGLPAALTVALAIGMSRMAKRNVIIASLSPWRPSDPALSSAPTRPAH